MVRTARVKAGDHPGGFRRRILATAVVAALAGGPMAPSPAAARTLTWTGGASFFDTNWSYSLNGFTNWSSNLLPANGDSLSFDGVLGLTNTNNTLSSITDLRFVTNAGAFTLNGNALTVNGDLTNYSSQVQTINLALTVGSSLKTWDGGTQGLQLNGLFTLGDHILTLDNKIAINNASSDFIIGETGTAGLSLVGGSQINSNYGFIGLESGSIGTAQVSGPGSNWSNTNDLDVGRSGKGTLNILFGGKASNKAAYVGYLSGSQGTATVDGAGSTWVNDNLAIGFLGSGALHIRNGGTVRSAQGTIGGGTGGNGTVDVDGIGSAWTNSSDLVLGFNSTGTLDILNGGTVSNVRGYVGYRSGSRGTATVSGANSSWLNSSTLYIGFDGSGTLRVDHGGAVSNDWGFVGYNSGSSGTAVVADAGSTWANANDLHIGMRGNGTLAVQKGGTVRSRNGYIGYFSGVQGIVTVDGAGSGWTNSDTLFVGNEGGGTLNILNGSNVSNAAGIIGNESTGVGFVAVDGINSKWTNAGTLKVGFSGEGTLTVTHGGQVSNTTGTLGFNSVGSGAATVTGKGSSWTNSRGLYVGNHGSGTLNILNGGQVSNAAAILGFYSDGSGTATVDGAGSSWVNNTGFYAGNYGSGTLNVLNGGSVTNSHGYLGYELGSIGTVTVDGAGSTWTNSDNLNVGYSGSGTLNIRNGGAVSANGLRIGSQGAVHLDGGSLTLASSSFAAGAQFSWTTGTLHYTGSAALANGGGSLPYPSIVLSNGKALQVDDTLTIGDGATLLLTGGQLKSHALNLAGGVVIASDSLNFADTGNLSGYGAVGAIITGGAGKSITASGGTLTLGYANVNGSFNYAGSLDTGNDQIVLLSADQAQLGSSTHLGAGGHLSTDHGANLASGNVLTYSGNASIGGSFTNNGSVSGSGGALTFFNDVNGAGSFAGDIVFRAGYSPGNSPAAVSFNAGNASYDGTSVLTLEILGAAPGSGYDQLVDIDHLSFDGTLQLVFGGGYVPVAGTRFTLFDFQSFSGTLSPGHIQVVGFDAARLDFSQLSTNGTLSVAAVPEPETTALMLAGLGLVGWAARRRRPAVI